MEEASGEGWISRGMNQLLQNQTKGLSLNPKPWARSSPHSSELAWGNELTTGSHPGLVSLKSGRVQDAAWFPALGIPASPQSPNWSQKGPLACRESGLSSPRNLPGSLETRLPQSLGFCTSCFLTLEMVGWHHQHNGHESKQTSGNSKGQGSLACCSPRGCKESDMT